MPMLVVFGMTGSLEWRRESAGMARLVDLCHHTCDGGWTVQREGAIPVTQTASGVRKGLAARRGD